MKLSYDETKELIAVVLEAPSEDARDQLNVTLMNMQQIEGRFYTGIVEHGPGMRLTTDQWFELLSRLPNRILRSELDLEGLLSAEQINRLPRVTG